MISKHTIDKVFEATRIEEVIGDFVQLKKSGSNLKGLSPFSDEKSPSFMVSPVKQIWKDFSSGKGGSAVTFLMEHEHYSYPEAIKYLARKYQIEIEETEQTQEQKQQADERESLYIVSEFANEHFQKTLHNTEEGKAIALSYFKERGFREDIIKKFQLGYNLDKWSDFTDAALKNGYDLKYLDKTGLTIVRETKKFDRFKGRVLFPIHSMSGRILGFGGRILGNNKKIAKYVNSPESDIYHKSKILYGIYYAKQTIAKEDNCYLVEGYTDVISLHQSGIENVVASSGTALTPDQIRLIKRLTNNITILFDGDAAGIRASFRGIDLILEQGMNVKVLNFPDGDDPDSFSKKVSDAELKEYIQNNTQDFIGFKVSLLMEEAQNDPIKKANLIREIVVSISKIPDRIQQEVFVQECARIMEISENVLFSELQQLSQKGEREQGRTQRRNPALEVVKQQQTEKKTTIIEKQLLRLEQEVIRILILYGNTEVDFVSNYVEFDEAKQKEIFKKEIFRSKVFQEIFLQLQEDETEFTNPTFQSIYNEIMNRANQSDGISIENLINHPDTNIAMQVTHFLMDDEKHMLSDWDSKEVFVKSKEMGLSKLVNDTIFNLRRILIDLKIQQLTAQVSNPEVDTSSILKQIMDYTALKQRLFVFLNRVVG
ncbi:DNA primase [Aureivirga sp. CE67]|uniref:DNA primase n=1 Tax=Aureivirga sp. CE67 TaxID=1788983 RepID=UPI0018CB93B0|nr:DNA primase [Aureivirga sp. CE67]